MTTTALKDIDQDTFEATAGTISYGDVSFGVFRNNLKLDGEIVYDEAGRVATHIRYKLSLSTIIWASDLESQNLAMDSLQDTLMEEGRKLEISDVGFGEAITTNLKGNSPDIMWGAKPNLIRCQPLGGVLAWEVVWECEFNVSRCASPGVLGGTNVPLMAFNYSLSYSVDDEGLVTRIISGYAQVPAMRGSKGPNSAPVPTRECIPDIEQAFDKITAIVPLGFRRVHTDRQFNYAKNRVEFTFVDSELQGEAFPDGIVKADMDYDFASKPPGFAQWIATLSGTLTVAPGYHPSWAGLKFFSILANKIAKLQKAIQRFPSGVLVPLQVNLGHKLFTRTSRFSVQFLVTACLENLTSEAGIWDRMNTDPARWAKSMQDAGVFDKRGVSKLRFQKENDQLVNLCGGTVPKNLGADLQQISSGGLVGQTLFCPKATEERSYLAYDEKVSFVKTENVTLHRFAQAVREVESTLFPFSVPVASITANSIVDHISQVQTIPDEYVLVYGRAARIGFRPEPRQLKTIGGVELERVAVREEGTALNPSTPATTFFGCPLYVGRWTHLYRVKNRRSSGQYIESESSPVACNHQSKTKEVGGNRKNKSR